MIYTFYPRDQELGSLSPPGWTGKIDCHKFGADGSCSTAHTAPDSALVVMTLIMTVNVNMDTSAAMGAV